MWGEGGLFAFSVSERLLRWEAITRMAFSCCALSSCFGGWGWDAGFKLVTAGGERVVGAPQQAGKSLFFFYGE